MKQKKFDIETTDWLIKGMSKEELETEKKEALTEFYNNICEDCKYHVDDKCTHPSFEYCHYGELWTPYWYEENELKRNVLNKDPENTGINIFDYF